MEVVEGYFLLFMLYSFLGWFMETLSVSIQNKKFANRGFLLGPYCPIYGFGALFIIFVLGRWSYNPLVLFVASIIGCGALEYFTSWIMEKVFKARWWDYSNRKFNLNGRVCLLNLIAFGFLGLIVFYVINPVFANLILKLQLVQLKWISIILAVIYVTDVIISFDVIYGFRKTTKQVNIEERTDNTEQITQMVRKLLAQKSFLHRRFLNAYPRLQAVQIKIKEIKTKIEDATNDAKEAFNEKSEALKAKIEDATNDAKEAFNEKSEALKAKIEDATNDAKVAAAEKRKALKAKIKQAANDTKEKISLRKKYPKSKFKGKKL